MNPTTITINQTALAVKEHEGQRVVTLKEIDTVHQRPEGTARRNFNANRGRFIEGVDYFMRNPSEAASELGIIAPNGLVLITESGYLMLVKSFTDDLAWSVQRQLVNTYFRTTARPDMVALPKDYPSALRALAESVEQCQALEAQAEANAPKVVFADAVTASHTSILIGELAKLLKQNGVETGQNRLYDWLRKNGYLSLLV